MPVRIESIEHVDEFEVGTTENVSTFGVRVRVGRGWTVNEPVKLESPPGVLRSRGWVVYSERLGDGNFALGLRLLQRQPRWSPE
jgi:hypothetical protein